jgi:nucleoside-diphosphate-sugar epimerase
VREVVARIFEMVGRGRLLIGALPQRPGEVPYQVADADRAEQLTGWRAQVDLESGLSQMVAGSVL